jgi:hypothetical protein
MSDPGQAQHDRDELERLLASEGWALVMRRIRETYDQKVRQILGDADPAETQRLRGFLQGLKCARDIPEIMRDECRPAAKV